MRRISHYIMRLIIKDTVLWYSMFTIYYIILCLYDEIQNDRHLLKCNFFESCKSLINSQLYRFYNISLWMFVLHQIERLRNKFPTQSLFYSPIKRFSILIFYMFYYIILIKSWHTVYVIKRSLHSLKTKNTIF